MEAKIVRRKTLTLSKKLEILKKYDKKSPILSQKDFALSMNIAPSSLRTLLQNRNDIEKNAAIGGSKKNRVKTGKYEDLEKVMYEWFLESRHCNIPISGYIVKEKASEVAQKLRIENFTPSNGWLDRFRTRHGIVYKKICGESATVNIEDADFWKANSLPRLIKNYASCDIYNADEFGLFFKAMPDKSLTLKDEQCHGGKLSKERVTVLLCSNADGSDKRRPLVIGKAAKPRCFKNIKRLPCDYAHQRKAWMTGPQFIKYVSDFDIEMRKQNRHVILFVDNCAAHPQEIPDISNVCLEFLPANTTSVLQPMDQGIIKVLKQHYRKRLVKRFLHEMETKSSRSSVTLLDAMNYLSAAWDAIETKIIQNCFKKAGFITDADDDMDAAEEKSDTIDDEDWQAVCEYLAENADSLQNYLNIDKNVITSNVRTIDDIIGDTIQDAAEEEDPDEVANGDVQERIPSIAEVMEAFSTIRLYTASVDTAASHEELLRHINKAENALLRSRSSNRQTKLEEFFSKTE